MDFPQPVIGTDSEQILQPLVINQHLLLPGFLNSHTG
jgi:hypothetical protein